MKVWIDQNLCTGDGLCAEICPSVFELHTDGLAYVKNSIEKLGSTALIGNDGQPLYQGTSGVAEFLPELEDAVLEAIAECPGECIFME